MGTTQLERKWIYVHQMGKVRVETVYPASVSCTLTFIACAGGRGVISASFSTKQKQACALRDVFPFSAKLAPTAAVYFWFHLNSVLQSSNLSSVLAPGLLFVSALVGKLKQNNAILCTTISPSLFQGD